MKSRSSGERVGHSGVEPGVVERIGPWAVGHIGRGVVERTGHAGLVAELIGHVGDQPHNHQAEGSLRQRQGQCRRRKIPENKIYFKIFIWKFIKCENCLHILLYERGYQKGIHFEFLKTS